jgi:hemerythrin-like domain-containing protein
VKSKAPVTKPEVPHVLEVLQEGHREILDHLDKLLTLAFEPRSAPNDESRTRARAIVAFFSGPAREHNYDEERHVFPLLRACEDGEVRRVAETLCEEHAWIELYWLEIEPQLAEIAAGAPLDDARALRAGAELFAAATRHHVRLEESLLYPEMRDRLKPAQVKAIKREMEARRAHRGARG